MSYTRAAIFSGSLSMSSQGPLMNSMPYFLSALIRRIARNIDHRSLLASESNNPPLVGEYFGPYAVPVVPTPRTAAHRPLDSGRREMSARR